MNIKDSTVKKIANFQELIESFIMKVNTEDAYTFAVDIIRQSGVMAEIKANTTPDGMSRTENVEELLNGIKEYTKNGDNTLIAEYLQNIALLTDMDKDSPKDNNRITLMTIHSAKGLEFKYVYIVGMEEGLFPGNNSIQSEQALEEERRLFYVALTRAATKATISYAQTRYRWGNLSNAVPSRFLRDIDVAYLSAGFVKDSIDTENFSRPDFSRSNYIRKNPVENKLNLLKQKQSEIDADVPDISPGKEVEHARFGRGRVTDIEIEGNETRAKIDFYSAGSKTLILRYAKLSVIKEPE
jgi:DNA helicase-2/ATP-dependent DNA helicase PcrA